MLSAPSTIGLAHVLWWLNRWDELESNIGATDKHNDGTSDISHPVAVYEDGTSEDVDCKDDTSALWFVSPTVVLRVLTDTTTDEREEEGRISRQLWWNLEFCTRGLGFIKALVSIRTHQGEQLLYQNSQYMVLNVNSKIHLHNPNTIT